jgi:hypothetical protein
LREALSAAHLSMFRTLTLKKRVRAHAHAHVVVRGTRTLLFTEDYVQRV